ncbi:MAG: response regulator [candidate division FCPU426 bacterium]
MPKQRILVIEDDEDIRELLRYNLAKEGYQIVSAPTAEEGLKMARQKPPVLILLDLMLPGMDGLEACRRLKKEAGTAEIPVVMLTAKGEETDIVSGLELGAADYVTKPFSPKVLVARLRAVLRRPGAGEPQAQTGKLEIHDLSIDAGRHEVRVKGKRLELTITEFRLLQFLASKPGWVFTRYQIVDGVKGDDYPVTARSVDVQVVGLRKKLGAAGKYIETVRGVGYRFQE